MIKRLFRRRVTPVGPSSNQRKNLKIDRMKRQEELNHEYQALVRQQLSRKNAGDLLDLKTRYASNKKNLFVPISVAEAEYMANLNRLAAARKNIADAGGTAAAKTAAQRAINQHISKKLKLTSKEENEQFRKDYPVNRNYKGNTYQRRLERRNLFAAGEKSINGGPQNVKIGGVPYTLTYRPRNSAFTLKSRNNSLLFPANDFKRGKTHFSLGRADALRDELKRYSSIFDAQARAINKQADALRDELKQYSSIFNASERSINKKESQQFYLGGVKYTLTYLPHESVFTLMSNQMNKQERIAARDFPSFVKRLVRPKLVARALSLSVLLPTNASGNSVLTQTI